MNISIFSARSAITSAILALATLSSTHQAQATGPDIFDFYAGTEAVLQKNADANILIGVTIDQRQIFFKAEAAIDPRGNGSLPLANVRLAYMPLDSIVDAGELDRLKMQFGFIPIEIRKNEAIGNEFTLDLSAVTMQLPVNFSAGAAASQMLKMKLVVDAVGYRIAEIVGDSKLQAFKIGGINAVIEYMVKEPWVEVFAFGLEAGASADIAYGSLNGKNDWQSEMKAYARITVDIKGYVRLFTEVAETAMYLGHDDSMKSAPIIMGGISGHW
jgi:hypothetical protein